MEIAGRCRTVQDSLLVIRYYFRLIEKNELLLYLNNDCS